MQHAALISFLNGLLSAKDFGNSIKAEVNVCELGVKSRGAGSVFLTRGQHSTITRSLARRLLGSVLEGQLPHSSAVYLADAVIMSDDFDFQDEVVSEIFYMIADESGPLTQSELQRALARLES